MKIITMSNSIVNSLNNDCSNCLKGKVFKEKSILFNFEFPKINEHCSHWNYKFEKEKGYFFGVMYVNYGLTVAQGIAAYVIAQFFFTEIFNLKIMPIIAVVIITMGSIYICLSRLVWIYMFKNYSM